jgi:hypothetical protein
MGDRSKTAGTEHGETHLEVTHLRREARTALELAVVALAPWTTIQRLASAAGLLEALSELPPDSPPARALVPKVLGLAREALAQWQKWEKDHLEQKLARG